MVDGEHPLALIGSRREAGPQSFLDAFLKLSREKTSTRTAEIKADLVVKCCAALLQDFQEVHVGSNVLLYFIKW